MGDPSNNLRIGQFNHHLVRRGFMESAAPCFDCTEGSEACAVADVIC